MSTLTHNLRVFRTCTGKKQYISVEEAQERVRRLERTRGVILYWYQCPYCHACHITKKPNGNPR